MMMNPESLMMSLAFGSKSGGKKPTGTKEIAINANGTVTEDVSEFASVEVSVDVPNPSAGTLEITENGSYDVTDYAGASVNVAVSGGDDIVAQIIMGTAKRVTNNDVTLVRAYSFKDTDVEYVSFPNVTNVEVEAFSGCQMLKSVNVPKSKYIRSYAFKNCYVLENIDLQKVVDIGTYAFNGCQSISNIEVPELTCVNINSFRDCKALTKFVADKAKGIANYGFCGCTSLKTVDILGLAESGSYYIGGYAFSNCTSLESLIIRESDGVMRLNSSSSGLESCENLSVYVPDELVDAYKEATNWSTISDKIKPLSEYVES